MVKTLYTSAHSTQTVMYTAKWCTKRIKQSQHNVNLRKKPRCENANKKSWNHTGPVAFHGCQRTLSSVVTYPKYGEPYTDPPSVRKSLRPAHCLFRGFLYLAPFSGKAGKESTCLHQSSALKNNGTDIKWTWTSKNTSVEYKQNEESTLLQGEEFETERKTPPTVNKSIEKRSERDIWSQGYYHHVHAAEFFLRCPFQERMMFWIPAQTSRLISADIMDSEARWHS